MKKIGHDINQEELTVVMKNHDIRGDGVISKDEFKAMLIDETAL